MHIVHIASELAPIAKVGGLGDVVLGLCRELSWKGNDVDIVIPKYDCIDGTLVRDLSIDLQDVPCTYNGEPFNFTVWVGWVENLKVYFIDPRHHRRFFNRGCFYGCEDDLDRYLLFAKAALEFVLKKPLKPNILHLHDWQTAIIPVLCQDIYKPQGYAVPKTVFTIHNMEYQGKCHPSDLNRINLQGQNYLTQDKLQDNLSPDLVNLLKGGIVYSDFVTTVSESYAKEVKTPAGGKGLEKTLIKHENKFKGILNGIDYSYWNPEIDRYLPAHFSSREYPSNKKDRSVIDNKAFIKKILRERLMLEELHSPIVACIARLVPQKGVELIKHALRYSLERGAQFVLLGSSPIHSINEDFQALKQHYASHTNVHLVLHHQEELAHLIYAGADMFIVPSLFEPCGLTQMIALKYGAIPIVRRTGGLADTIVDVDFSGKIFQETNGYVFDEPTNSGVESAMGRAIDCWFQDPEKWHRLMVQGMNIDFSWNQPSNHYLDIYTKL